MQLPLKTIISLLFSLCFCLKGAQAQQIYLDSLNRLLARNEISKAERVTLLCKLAKANFEQNLPLSFKQVAQAQQLSNGLKDGKSKALVFATMIHLYVWKKDLKKAYQSLDSAQYYAKKTKDRLTLGFVWFRNGWLDLINDENDKAISKMLKALDFFKGQGAYEYESTVYHYLASFYGYGNNPAKQQKYAQLCYQTAVKSNQIDLLNNALFTIGQTYFDRFKLDTTNRGLLDSALLTYKKALLMAKKQEGRLVTYSNTAAVALNTANTYFQYFPPTYRDSAEKYTNIAIAIATKTNLQEVLLNCYGLKSEYALRDGNYAAAENILLEGLSKIAGSPVKMSVTRGRIFMGLSNIAEKKGDPAAALNYFKQYFKYYKNAFDEEKVNSIIRIEAQYETAKKEQEIAYLHQESAYARKLNIYYVITGIAGIAALLFLLISYNYKLKASVRKQELIDQQKDAAELKAQLKEAETIRLQTEQTLLQERQERLEREVLAGNLQIEEKKELLEHLSGKVNQESGMSLDEQIKKIVSQQKKRDKDFEEYKADFLDINPVFFERLQQRANQNLSRLDLKYCSYMLMGLSNKEVSIRLGIEPKSVRMSRYRLKQKLGLGKDDDLNLFLQQIGIK